MDGKVEISILQWEQMRAELSAHKENIAKLENEAKSIKIVITDKRLNSHYKYNRWTGMNELIPSTHDVEEVKYIGFEDIKNILYEESKDKVQETIQNLEGKQIELETNIREIKKTNDENRVQLIEKHEKELTIIKEEHKEKVTELQAIIDEKEYLKKEEENEKMKAEIAELKIELQNTRKKLPFWVKK